MRRLAGTDPSFSPTDISSSFLFLAGTQVADVLVLASSASHELDHFPYLCVCVWREGTWPALSNTRFVPMLSVLEKSLSMLGPARCSPHPGQELHVGISELESSVSFQEIGFI